MNIKKMTATFGRLNKDTLDFTSGLNVISAPNEGGKSTWCAFLRAMFYGIPTKERDKAGYIAEKNRYAPWSGAAMEGSVDLTYGGRDITLRRFQKGASPFSGFEAVDSTTGDPIPGLTADNAGELLLGVPREVYERSAFVGQSGVAVDGNPELEKRIAALVSSGEEDVSFSQTERRLKDWLNRRKHNKSGLIPKLEGELDDLCAVLSRLDRVGRALAEAQGEKESLAAKHAELTAEQAEQAAHINRVRRVEYDKAVSELTRARAELGELTAAVGALPDKETLLAAQGDLAYYNTLGANLKIAENDAVAAEAALREAQAAARDPLFQGMTAEGARMQAKTDCETARNLPKGVWVWLWLALGWAALGMIRMVLSGDYIWGIVSIFLGVGHVVRFVMNKRKRAVCAESLARYAAATPDDILRRAEAYAALCRTAETAEQRASAVSDSARQMSAQRSELIARLLALVHPFAPTVTDVFGVSAALSKALSLDERVATARVKLEGAQKLVSSIPAPDPGTPVGPGGPAPISLHPPQQIAAMLAAVQGELTRVESALALAKGERNTLGNPDELEARRGAALEELERRRSEYDALTLALETLGEANAELQSRFSPALNQRAGEIFSALTGGRYADVTLNRGFEASAREAGDILPRRALTLSQGTVDQLYLAVRLAVCDMALPAGEPVPLVLDDALANFDDTRMALALDYLNTQPRQILLFTCHTREGAHLNSL